MINYWKILLVLTQIIARQFERIEFYCFAPDLAKSILVNHDHYLNSENGHIQCKNIPDCLYQLGIKTIYIEGGAIITYNFIKEHVLNILQLYISPRAFGPEKLMRFHILDDVADRRGFDITFHASSSTWTIYAEQI